MKNVTTRSFVVLALVAAMGIGISFHRLRRTDHYYCSECQFHCGATCAGGPAGQPCNATWAPRRRRDGNDFADREVDTSSTSFDRGSEY